MRQRRSARRSESVEDDRRERCQAHHGVADVHGDRPVEPLPVVLEQPGWTASTSMAGRTTFILAGGQDDCRRPAIQITDKKAAPVPKPPAGVFDLVEYRNRQGAMLPAFVTPDRKDGRRHPAIVWIGGGDSNSL